MSDQNRKIHVTLFILIVVSAIVPISIEHLLFPKTPLSIYLLFLVPIIYICFYYDKKGIIIGIISINAIHFIWGLIVLRSLYEIDLYNRAINHSGLTLISLVIAILLGRLFKIIEGQQTKLKDSESLYRNVVETSPNPMLIHKAGNIVYVNTAAVKLSGLGSKDKLIGQPIEKFMHPTSKAVYNSRLEFLKKQDLVRIVEYQMVRPDGAKLFIEILGKRITYKGDNAILAVGTDVTARKEKEAKLRKSEALLAVSQRMAHIGSWEADLVENKIHWSKETYRIFGVTPENIMPDYQSFLTFVPSEEKEFVDQKTNEALEGKVYSLNHRIIRKDGVERFVYQQAEITYNEQGQPIYLVGTIQDITETREIQLELKQSEEKFRSLVQHSYDMIAIVDAQGIITYLSPSIERKLGYNIEDITGHPAVDFICDEDVKYGRERLKEVLNAPNKANHSQIRIKDKSGKLLHVELVSTNLIDNPNIKGIVVNLRDVTSQKKSYETIQHLAFHDDVTSLLNKRGLDELLANQIAKGESFSVLFLDLDNFKFVNDSLGHYVGDMLLKNIAILLREQVNEHGEVARMGGDEFVILLRHTPNRQSENLANNIIDLFSQPFDICNYQFFITASIGVVTYPDGGQDIDSLLKHADMAMYEAKHAGKNTFRRFDNGMKKINERTFQLQNDIRNAVKSNEFTLYYQPRVRTVDLKVVGAEALVRWNHPKLGMISPNEFIPIAENSGLIVPLGEWIFETACKQLMKWKEDGQPDLKLSINFSTVQFMQIDLHKKVKKIVELHKVNPQNIEIEITESAIIENDLGVQENIKQLKELGIEIAIDDFGTGYSSMLYIKKFKADTIKIDRTFIANLQEDDDNADIVLAIINLAKALKLNIVAEGVETIEQFEKLKQMDCQEMQGYYFAKPLPIAEFEKYV
ncbi:EAL domain-containing protein [Radiobacillus sp. PE A8.2]|uniref:sensor domain-containing protein n=1 Tax=Radiobacillus sp. PE A8.2 TaxID=3380349 RepID=UPI003891011E